VLGLFDVIALYVGDVPDVFRVFTFRVAGELAGFRPFEVAFARVFGWDAHVIKIEDVVVRFGVPEDDFIAATEAALVVEAVAEVPDDPVAQGQAVLPEYWVELNVERHDLAVVNVVADLPADAPLCGHRYYVDMGGKRPVLQGFADRHVHIIIEGFRGSFQRLGDEYHRC